ncbi:hypothetical protein B0T17DRAFT_59271 [Bombardia bombarda]|uniref:Rhodopsin domain-containing protein n=1 Tax=Bombardia bombarda TaxID=252184 RepID=A0AA39XKS6_9PEZI|nr:hypothetical protein B0T17DRAFT_59271 [Bombardia bombarda]
MVEWLYPIGFTIPRINILLLYLRVFRGRKVRVGTWIMMVVLLAHCVAALGLCFAICQPYAYNWDTSIAGGHCGNLFEGYKWVSVPNIVIDAGILVLPLDSLYRVQVSRSRKVGLFITFLTGGLGVITGILRFVIFINPHKLESDVTYMATEPLILTVVEPCTYFICSCLPGMRPLVFAVYKKLSCTTTSRIHQYNSNTGGTAGSSWQPKRGSRDISLPSFGNNASNSHTTSVSGPRAPPKALLTSTVQGGDGDRYVNGDYSGRFIRLEETVTVEHFPPSPIEMSTFHR